MRIMKDGLFIDQDKEGLKEYKFLDERINELYYFLSKGMKNPDRAKEITFYTIGFNHVYDYLMPLAALKNYLKKNNVDGMAILKESDEMVNSILSELNARYASCFRAFLKLAEDNWNEEQALKTTLEMINSEEIKEIENNLKSMKKKLIYN